MQKYHSKQKKSIKLILLCNLISKVKKSQKSRVAESQFTQLFNRYGIHWVLPYERAQPEGSECVWQKKGGIVS